MNEHTPGDVLTHCSCMFLEDDQCALAGVMLGRALYGDDALPLIYSAQEPPRISTTVTSPLACEELCYLGLPKISEGTNEHLGASCLRSRYQHIRDKERGTYWITLGYPYGLSIIPLGIHTLVTLHYCILSQRIWLPLLDALTMSNRLQKAHLR